ncbi:MAG: hypothetical protein LBT25_01280 [Candidatus Symbiothrix sp.]|jgi:hypothetical protein|nr:hypothetical protein [Candidatus Symbiothrix sp.]
MKTLKYLLIGLSVIFAIIGFLAFALIELYQYETTHAPKDFYKERLEFISEEPLPSCKILRSDYISNSFVAAIIQLNETDYAKVLKATQATKGLIIAPKVSFWGSANELIKEEKIDINKVIVMYEGHHGTYYFSYLKHIGFLPPNIIIYEENLNN